MNNVEVPHRRDRWKKSPRVSASIGGDQIRRDRRIKSPGVSPALGAWEGFIVPSSCYVFLVGYERSTRCLV